MRHDVLEVRTRVWGAMNAAVWCIDAHTHNVCHPCVQLAAAAATAAACCAAVCAAILRDNHPSNS